MNSVLRSPESCVQGGFHLRGACIALGRTWTQRPIEHLRHRGGNRVFSLSQGDGIFPQNHFQRLPAAEVPHVGTRERVVEDSRKTL